MTTRALPLLLCLLCAPPLLALDQPIARGQNLVANPGFEQGLAGWTNVGDATAVAADDHIAHAGGKSLRVSGATLDSSGGVMQTIAFDKPLQHPFRVSGWSKSRNAELGQDYNVYLDVHYADGTPLWGRIASFGPGTHDWQYSELIFDVAKPVKSIEVFVLFRKAKGTVWFDDIEVTPAPFSFRNVRVLPGLFGGASLNVTGDTTLPAKWTAEVSGGNGVVARGNGDAMPIRLTWAGESQPGPYSLRLTATDTLLGETITETRAVSLSDTGPSRGFALWTESSMKRVLPSGLPDALKRVGTGVPARPTGDGGRDARPYANVALAGNEYESFQIILLAAPGKPLRNLTVQPGDLVCAKTGKRIAAANIEWQQVGFVKVAKVRANFKGQDNVAGWWPDPLLPVKSFDLQPGLAQPIWVTVFAPAGTPAGDYTGDVKLLADGQPLASVGVQATVYPLTLPVEGHMKTAFALMDGYLEKLYGKPLTAALRQKYGDFVLKHRLNPDDISRTDPPAIEDLLHYNKRGLNAFNVLNMVKERGDATWVCWSPLEVYTPAFKQHLIERLDPYVKKLRETGLINKAYIYTFDERGKDFYPIMRDFFGMVKDRYPEIHTLTTAQVPQDPKAMHEVRVDWNCPLTPGYNYAQAEKCRAEGLQVWAYVCCGPGAPYANILADDPLIESRVIWWQAYQQQMDGFLYWGLNIWDGPHNDKPIDPDARVGTGVPARPGIPFLDWSITTGGPTDEQWLQELHGDGRLIYAGKDGPIGSIRLANIRDGLEDYEYLWLLAKKLGSVEAARQACSPVTQGLTEFTRDPAVVEKARAAVVKAIGGK